MFRRINRPLLSWENRKVNLIRCFHALTYQQVLLYDAYVGASYEFQEETPIRAMASLSLKYHFVNAPERGWFARQKTDLDNPDAVLPFWVYLDFLQIGQAGAYDETNLPYTPIVFEHTATRGIVEVLVAPGTEKELDAFNRAIKLYDLSVPEDPGRRRIIILQDWASMERIHVDYVLLYCKIDQGKTDYKEP